MLKVIIVGFRSKKKKCDLNLGVIVLLLTKKLTDVQEPMISMMYRVKSVTENNARIL